MRYEVMDGVDIIDFLEMNPDIFNKIVLKLENETNIKFKYYQKNHIVKRIKSRIKSLELNSDTAYYDYLKHHPGEIELFLDSFTINYSYFFRNYGVFQRLVNIIEEADLTREDKIKIWSCPCASGEEPYSLAILLEEKRAFKKDFPKYEIIGSDINPNAIEAAIKGIYGKHELNETPEVLRKKYFTTISDTAPKYKLAKKIRENVQFINEDITLGHQKSQKYDIILCRNFIIYINQIYRKELLKQLKRSLKDQGILVVGKTEKIKSNNALELIDPLNKFYKYSSRNNSSYKSLLIPKSQEKAPSERLAAKLEEKIFESRKKTYKKKARKDKRNKRAELTDKKDEDKHKLKKTNQLPPMKNNHPTKVKRMNKKIIELNMEAENQKNTYSLEEFNKKLKKAKLYSKRDKRKPVEKSSSKDRKQELQALKKKMDKELSFLNQQRKDLNEKISQFQIQNAQLEQEKRKFERKKILLKRQKKQFKRELEWFRKQKEQLETRKAHLEAKRAKFLKEKRRFEAKRTKLEKSQNYSDGSKIKKKSIEEYTLSLGDYFIHPQDEGEKEVEIISLYGLGSSYVLILVDPITKVVCMAHILFPKPKSNQQMSKIEKKHQYASLCIPYLMKKMLIKGASEKMISAYIVGGAQIFKKKYQSIKETYAILTGELDSYGIKLLASDIGRKKRRTIKYKTQEEQLRLKCEEEETFRTL